MSPFATLASLSRGSPENGLAQISPENGLAQISRSLIEDVETLLILNSMELGSDIANVMKTKGAKKRRQEQLVLQMGFPSGLSVPLDSPIGGGRYC